MLKKFVWLSTVFGVGYFPKAPGTAGTAFAMLIYFVLPNYFFSLQGMIVLFFAIIALSLLSVYFTSESEKILGHDNGKIVIDEFVGYFFSIIFLPKHIIFMISAFLLFRFFDIKKPWIIDKVQNLPSGWGIMLDDIVAGIFTNLILQILWYLFKIKYN